MPGYLMKIEATAVEIEENKEQTCFCGSECLFSLPVFETDASKEVFKKQLPDESLAFKITNKTKGKTATVSTNALKIKEEAAYYHLTINWYNLKVVLGFGVYELETARTLLGVETIETYLYELKPEDSFAVGKTVLLESECSGWREYLQRDFEENLSIRLPGTFGNMESTVERDVYQTQDFENVQNRDVVINSYTLSVSNVPVYIFERLGKFNLTGSKVFVTALPWGYDNPSEYRRFPIFLESFSDINHRPNKHCDFSIKFVDKIANNITVNNYENR